MKVLDLFSGIGGFSLGLEAVGMETIAFCEKELFCQANLKKNWPDIPCYNDVTTLDGSEYAEVNVICGGFPCQDVSLAGTGKGLAGARSGLWSEYHRIIKEAKPQWVAIENVSALRSRGLEEILRQLAEIGYDAEWYCISAAAVGARHRRDRIWILAYPQGQRHACGEPSDQTSQERAVESSGKPEGLRFAEFGNTSGIRNDELVADTHQPRLQRRLSEILCQRAGERLAWESGASVANADGEPPQWIAEPRLERDPWRTEPNVGRVVDGVSTFMDRIGGIPIESAPRPKEGKTKAGRIHRIKALGNAIVPQIAQIIGQAIMEYENDGR